MGKRVVQVLYSGLGGHGSVAFALAGAGGSSLRHAFLFAGVEPLLPAYSSIAHAGGHEFRQVRTRRRLAWLAWPALYRALSELRPDAIVMHSVKTILPCALYACLHRVPLLAVEHQANALKRPSEWWVSRAVMRFADGVVVLTEDYRTQLEKRLGNAWRGDKVRVIANGVDTDLFAPTHPRAGRERPWTIGMAARITGIKRQDILVDAIELLCKRDGRDAWRLTIAGEGDAQAGLAARIRARGLDDVVLLPGLLDETGLARWFRTLDIYAHASEGETLSTSLLQAMAMGLPIVGSDVPGIGDLLATDGGVGIAVGQSPDEFAAAFTRIRDQDGLGGMLGARARQLAERRFSRSVMAGQYRRSLETLWER